MFRWNWRVAEEELQSDNEIKFHVQGREHIVSIDEIGPETTLNDYLRHKMHLTGTKRMCLEGGCGACVVAVTKSGNDKVIAVNSCLVSILTCHGWNIDTVEGIGGPLSEYHPVQKALANFNGTQCGFCSPGMVMNMYALCKNNRPTMKQVESSFGGNICRCTGYRPILTAFKSLCQDTSSELLGAYPDIEDFVMVKHISPKETCETNFDRKPKLFKLRQGKWLKVVALKDLLSSLAKIGDEPYMLVAGNTAKGVYKLPKADVYIDIIEVAELIGYVLNGDTLTLGANMSLTTTRNLFNQVSEINSKFAYLKTMASHIDLIAHIPVRNIGTLAGNLMLKHLHREFPSDVFLLLETFGATLVIVDTNGTETIKTPAEFLSYDMTKKVIKNIQLSGLSSDYKYDTFKIMPRAQNAHAIVNAGIVFELNDENIVQEARIVIGNINPEFIHATKTENYVKGKALFMNETIQAAFQVLKDELKPEASPPEPSPEFRKQLAIALLYKAILKICPPEKVSDVNKSGGEKLSRPISSGMQDYETNESLYPLTKAIPKIEALAQTSGQAQYIEDMPDLPHQLYGKLVLAKAAANSDVINIDASRAMALNGVVQFITAKDIPGDNNFIPTEFGSGVVEKIFCEKTIQYYHQPVGLLVVSERSVLEEAAELIEVTYSAPKKKPLINIRDIIKAGATDKMIKEKELKPAKIGNDVKHKISGTFDIMGQYHFHMELQCCVAVPTEDGIDLYPSTQWMDLVQSAVSKMLKIPQSKINIIVRRCGGAFGAKISRNSQIACAAALGAWILKRPVNLTLTLKENMELIGKRFPMSADYEVELNDAGVIQHLTSQLYSDHSVGGNESINQELLFAMLLSNYNTDPFDLVYFRTKSDTSANTWTRAPGSAEALCFIESIMDHISYELNMDPLDVRMNNITKQKKLIDYLGDLKEWADIDERKRNIVNFNKENRWKKRGISMVPMAWNYSPAGPITAVVSIYHIDGSVSISHGGIEIGQGINTKAAQVCAYKFNIPLENIRILPSNSMDGANCTTTGGSVTSDAVCYAIDKACDELLLRLKPYRDEDSSQTWLELIQKAFKNFVLLTTNAQYDPNAPGVNPYIIYGSCAAEVEVDVLTGQYQITRVDLIEDTGTSLSPFIDVGQIEGAFVMGLGYYTSENLVYDENGKLLTNNTWTYKPPGAQDIPIDFRVKFPKNNPNPLGVLQSKAVGEPPLCMSVSIPLAIRNALASARTDSNPSTPAYYCFDGPTTVENIFMNSANDYKNYKL
ncbi:hypothetical protein HHI36_019863 [Cryptolaemus montrouzieri]|uniref:Indole-3-acetaldehyde oxidase n=1 Tax=Cryptolaemus montrouzieri TaxID=559131 RepID=A0ABD2N903_9CUCU